MFLNKLKTALTAVLLLAAVGLGGLMTALARPGSDAAGGSTTTVSAEEFKQLKPTLDLKNQPWATIPWKYSITEARRVAAATNKPIFMVVNTGNALGCV